MINTSLLKLLEQERGALHEVEKYSRDEVSFLHGIEEGPKALRPEYEAALTETRNRLDKAKRELLSIRMSIRRYFHSLSNPEDIARTYKETK